MLDGLMLGSLPFGHPLAWQWAVFVSLMLMLWGLIAGLTIWTEGIPLAAVGLALFVCLSARPVLRYCGLQCFDCGAYRPRGLSVLYDRMECRKCGKRWRHGHQSDPAVFD